jgi:hypothetical protein
MCHLHEVNAPRPNWLTLAGDQLRRERDQRLLSGGSDTIRRPTALYSTHADRNPQSAIARSDCSAGCVRNACGAARK